MKKIASIALLTAMLCSLLCLTGCSPKTALTAEGFRSSMEEAGHTVADVSAQFAEYNQIVKVYVALIGSGAYQIEFYETDTPEAAQNLFANNKLIFEQTKGNSSSQSSINGTNSNVFKLTTSGSFRVLSRIDNTMIYIDAPEEYKSDINGLLKNLGY